MPRNLCLAAAVAAVAALSGCGWRPNDPGAPAPAAAPADSIHVSRLTIGDVRYALAVNTATAESRHYHNGTAAGDLPAPLGSVPGKVGRYFGSIEPDPDWTVRFAITDRETGCAWTYTVGGRWKRH